MSSSAQCETLGEPDDVGVDDEADSGSLRGGVPLTSVIMWRIETRHQLADADFEAISTLLHDAAEHDGFPPLSDHLLLEIATRGGDGFAAVLTYGDSDELAAYAQLARANASTVIELVVAPDARQFTNDLTVGLLRSALDVVASSGGGRVNWWVHHPVLGTDAVATEMGFELGRRLLQMRRDLPIQQPGGSAPTVATRSFVIGRDETEWLRVNNAAFHGHPEQGGWTAEMLRQRETEPWFDPDGFRLHERDGKLAAFCWTKIHADAVPAVGEIYVIAVDPEFHGLGLGKALTIAGLAYLGDHGLIVGMLHVDAANTAAMATYQRLGFSIHHEDHAYVTTLTGAHP